MGNLKRSQLIKELQRELELLKVRSTQGEHYERLKIQQRLKEVQKQLNMHLGVYKRELKRRNPEEYELVKDLL